jgi:hypothetical protein
MPILKTVITQNGASLGYHRAVSYRLDLVTGVSVARVMSYADEAAYVADKGHSWDWEVDVPVADLKADMAGAIDVSLSTNSISPFSGGTVVADSRDSLVGIKARKIAVLNESCVAQITAGFHSSALGSDRLYPAKPLDQTNLIASVVDSLIPGNPANYSTPFWCANGAVWAYELHSATQVQQVGRDGKAAIVAALFKNNGLAGRVSAATTVSEVNSINWS